MCFMVHHASDEMMVQTLEMLPFCGEFTLLNNTKKKKKKVISSYHSENNRGVALVKT